MNRRQRFQTRLAGGLVAFAICAAPAMAAGEVEETFFRAYYLEHEAGETEAALALYESVVANRSAPEELRTAAGARVSALQEDLAARDLARVMPEHTIAYFELSRPGEDVARLLDQLGLLGAAENADPNRFAVSPALISGALGLQGAAVAITGIDPRGGPPSGVAVLHPGDHQLVRGLLETCIPAACIATEPIHGHATYQLPIPEMQGQAVVTLTARLVVAGTDRAQVEGVVARLHGAGGRSLADNPYLAEMLAARGEGMAYFCLNAEPVKPMIHALVEQAGQNDPQVAMVASLLDIDSLVGLSGRFGVQQDGIGLDLALHLEEGHRNLVFNLLRMPNVDRRTLELVPAGVAFFSVSSLNPPSSVATGARDSKGQPVVSLMDFGREFFGNVTDIALFALPPQGNASSGMPIPDIAAVMRVNDVERSRALWSLVFGLGSQAAGDGSFEPASVNVDGAEAAVFHLAGVDVFMAAQGNDLILTPSRTALSRTLSARSNGQSVLQDPLFANSLDFFDAASTTALVASPGRCARIAAPFLSEDERMQMQPIAALFEETVLSFGVQQSETRLALQARLRNLPDVSPLVTMAIQQMKSGGASPFGVAAVRSEPVPVRAVAAPAHAPADPHSRAALEQQAAALEDDANGLNNLAWALLTEEQYGQRFDDLALGVSQRANELSGYSNWYYLDTLALACFRAGDVARAVELQQKAVEIATEAGEAESARESLVRYRQALSGSGV